MKRIIGAAALAFALTNAIFAKDMLAILPFTGGQGEDGETIAELFSFEKELTALFTPVPRTSINRAIRNEQKFQMSSGMTDPDTIAALGRQLGAQYVAAGSITALGAQKLLIIAIIKIDELRQVAGDIQTYATTSEIRGKLPAMAKTIAAASKKNTSALPLLAVPPVQLSGGANKNDADTMAQILAVYLIRTGKYAVHPRTKSLEQVQIEYGNQFGGDVADEYLPKIGKGKNPRLVLSVTARKLDKDTMFNAAVINLETGGQETGETVDYTSLEDGLRSMEELALKIAGQDNVVRARKAAEEAARKKQEAEAKRAAFKSKVSQLFTEQYPYSYWSIGFNAGSTFTTPLLTLSPNITIPLVKVAYVDLGCDFGFFTNTDIKDPSYKSYYPYIRVSAFVPFSMDNDDAFLEKFGFHFGLGYGCMITDYRSCDHDNQAVTHAFDGALGFLLINAIDISYSIRVTNDANHKLSIGYIHRFGKK
jgi:hypothetical protein